MIAMALIKLILWGIVCQAGSFSRMASLVSAGVFLGVVFTAIDIAAFHFFLGAENELPLAAVTLALLHSLAVSTCLFFYARTDDIFYSLLAVFVGAAFIVIAIPRYCFDLFFGAS